MPPPKRRTTATHNNGAKRDAATGKLLVSADQRQTRAKEPIFGPAVPAGEEFEYTTLACETQAQVRDELASLAYDVLNGLLPQQKGEFAHRLLQTQMKSLKIESEGGLAGAGEQFLANVLRQVQDADPDEVLPDLEADEEAQLAEFRAAIERSNG